MKVGHLGTLDPLATGVLPIAIGKATKLFDIFLTKKKGYIAEFSFGLLTDTLDITGNILDKSDIVPERSILIESIKSMIGESEQLPPKYSAKKINGVPAYKLARDNKDFELKKSKIIIYNIDLLEYNNEKVKLFIECSAGTYIRSIGESLAKSLNCYMTMSSLKRIKTGNFLLENCVDIEGLTFDSIENNIISINKCLSDFENIEVDDTLYFRLKNGQRIKTDIAENIYIIKYKNNVLGIANVKDDIMKLNTYLEN